MNTGNWTGVTFSRTTSYQELTSLGTNFSLAPTSQDFAMTTDGRLKYTGLVKKRFIVDASVETASPLIKIYKNGSPLDDSESFGVSRPRIANFLVDLDTNDYISLWLKGSSASSIAIVQVNLAATSTDRVL